MNNSQGPQKKNSYKLRIIIIILFTCYFLYCESLNTIFNQYQKDLKIAIEANKNGDYKKAEEYYLKAINDTDRKNHYPIRDLGKVYVSKGEYSKAEPLFKESLAICKKRYKRNDARTIDSLYILANFYSINGQYKDAELLLNEALLSVPNENPRGKIKLLEALGETYFLAKDYKNSEKFLLEALNLKNAIYEKDSPELVKSYIELLSIYSATNKAKKEQILKRTIKTCESTNKCEDGQLISLYMSSIILYMDKKDLVHSKFYADKALKKYDDMNIENINKPIDKISYLLNMHTISYAKGNKSKAIAFLNQALKLATELDGKNSTLSLNTIKNIQEIQKMEVK